MIDSAWALPGRDVPVSVAEKHRVSGRRLKGPFPVGTQSIYFGMGCFWGAERLFWNLNGVFVTAVGYQGGFTPNPTYEEVCSGQTGHAETVMVAFDPLRVTLDELLRQFWESHDPTQGMGQGNDVGTQYRSAVFTTGPDQQQRAEKSAREFGAALKARGLGPITTQIGSAPQFYFAETCHQQYLARNPSGYCGLKGTGVTCPIPTI